MLKSRFEPNISFIEYLYTFQLIFCISSLNLNQNSSKHNSNKQVFPIRLLNWKIYKRPNILDLQLWRSCICTGSIQALCYLSCRSASLGWGLLSPKMWVARKTVGTNGEGVNFENLFFYVWVHSPPMYCIRFTVYLNAMLCLTVRLLLGLSTLSKIVSIDDAGEIVGEYFGCGLAGSSGLCFNETIN